MAASSIYAIVSVIIVSLISLAGVFALSLRTKLEPSIKFLVSFAVGALLGDVFIHLLPELVESGGFDFKISMIILASIVGFFITEGFLHWHHHHSESDAAEHSHHPIAYLNLIGDGLHNFIDGLIIGGAYMVDIHVGIATTIAVILHEIPQEIGDFGVLIYAGFSKSKAIFYNFLSGLTALLGVIVALAAGQVENIATVFVAIGIGSFIYISLVDLVPEIHKSRGKIISQFSTVLLGIAVMSLLLFLE